MKKPLFLVALVALLATSCESVHHYSFDISGDPSYLLSYIPSGYTVFPVDYMSSNMFVHNIERKKAPTRIFDYAVYFADPPENYVFTMDEFPNKTFFANDHLVYTDSYSIDNANALYLYDVNSDGYRDFCFVEAYGSSDASYGVRVYDYFHQEMIYNMHERNRGINYFLDLDGSDLKIERTRTDKIGQAEYGSGIFHTKSYNNVYVVWNSRYTFNEANFKIQDADDMTLIYSASYSGDLNISLEADKLYLLTIEVAYANSWPNADNTVSFYYNGGDIYQNNFHICDYSLTGARNAQYQYLFYFTGGINSYKLDVSVNSFMVSYNFSLSNWSSQKTIASALGYNFLAPYITEIDFEEEVTLDDPVNYDSLKKVATVSDELELAKFAGYLQNSLAFKINSSYFTTDHYKKRRAYTFHADVYGLQTITALDNYLVTGGDMFYLTNTYFPESNNPTYKFAVTSGTNFTADRVNSAEVYTINYVDQLTFTRREAIGYSKDSAQFVLHASANRTFYIVNSNHFLNEACTYIYAITSSINFSSLFHL